jgi:hypothetical protein
MKAGYLLSLLLALIPVAVSGQGKSFQAPSHPHQPVQPPPGKNQVQPPLDAYQSYRALLGKMCANQHLELLSPGELDDLIEVNFHDALPGALQTRLDAADNVEKAACAHVTGGLACFNIAYIRAMDDVKLLPRFTRMVCDSGIVCRAPGECARQ